MSRASTSSSSSFQRDNILIHSVGKIKRRTKEGCGLYLFFVLLYYAARNKEQKIRNKQSAPNQFYLQKWKNIL